MALDDFLVNSDYPMDLVVFAAEGDITTFTGGYGTGRVPHGLPFTPLPFGVWSLDGGVTWQPITGMNSRPNQPFAYVYSDSTQVGINIELNSSSVPVKYRLFGLQPSGETGATTPPTFRVSDFSLNTDFNYSKLVASIVWPAQVTTGTTIITHSLGYIPEVAAWAENSLGRVYPLIGVYDQAGSGVHLTANGSVVQAVCLYSPGDIVRIHARVYGDRNG